MEITGSCFCNAVQFRVTEAPKAIVNCHCNFCRKHSGAAFSTFVAVPDESMEIVSGADSLSAYSFEDHAHKHFCRQCGSPVYNKNARYPGLCMIYFGGISASSGIEPTANIHCESQLSWIPSLTELKSFAQGITRQPK